MIKNVLLIMFSLLLISTIAMAKEYYTENNLRIVATELTSDSLSISTINKVNKICDWFLKTSKDPCTIDYAKEIKNRCEVERYIVNGTNSINDIPEKYLNSTSALPATFRLVRRDYLNSEKYLNDYMARYGTRPILSNVLSNIACLYLSNENYKDGVDFVNNFTNKYPTLNTSDVKYKMMLLYLGSGDMKAAINILDNMINNTKDHKEKANLLCNKLAIYNLDGIDKNYYEVKQILVPLKRLAIETNNQNIINYANDNMKNLKKMNKEIIL